MTIEKLSSWGTRADELEGSNSELVEFGGDAR